MATILFSGQVIDQVVRVVDFGSGSTPRLAVETQQPADAMGGHGWGRMSSITVDQLAALLIASGILHA